MEWWQEEPFEPAGSVWRVIEENSKENERIEIREILGESLVEEVQELHREVTSLLEIWRDFRDDTAQKEQELTSNNLPEPPMVRENLKKQVKLFIELLQEKAAKDERDLFRTLSPSQSSLAKEIMTGSSIKSSSRPSTASSSRDGRETPMRSTPRKPLSRSGSKMSDHFSSKSKEARLEEIEQLADTIRKALEDERDALNEDILFLQKNLMQESDYRKELECSKSQPSIKELRDLGTKLEKELLKKDDVPRAMKKDPVRRLSSGSDHSNQSSSPRNSPASQGRLIPSPPAAAPTSSARPTSFVQRKYIAAKTFSLPEELSNEHETHHTPSSTSNKPGKRIIVAKGNRTSLGKVSATKSLMVSPASTNTRIQEPVGTAATKLRNMVLECRDSGGYNQQPAVGCNCISLVMLAICFVFVNVCWIYFGFC